MSNGSLLKITAYTNSNMCFNGADVAGGVSFFLIDKTIKNNNVTIKYITKCEESIETRKLCYDNNIILDNMAFKIIEKIGSHEVFIPTSGDNPFGISSTEHGSILEGSQGDAILIKDGIEEYFSKDTLRNSGLIDKYKITIGIMNPDRGGVNNSTSWNVINIPKALLPRYVIPKNFMILFASNNKDEASCFYMYAKTKIFRFLALQGLSGASLASAETWRFVPNQNYSLNSDIDWTQPVSNIDQQLYRKYNLSDEDIAYIEKTIKPMK